MEQMGWNGSDEDQQEFFDKLVEKWMSEEPGKTHHEIMTLYYLEPIANTLWSLNNNLGSPQDYYGLILYGLDSGVGLNRIIRDIWDLSNEEVREAYQTSLNTVINPTKLTYDCP